MMSSANAVIEMRSRSASAMYASAAVTWRAKSNFGGSPNAMLREQSSRK